MVIQNNYFTKLGFSIPANVRSRQCLDPFFISIISTEAVFNLTAPLMPGRHNFWIKGLVYKLLMNRYKSTARTLLQVHTVLPEGSSAGENKDLHVGNLSRAKP